MPVLPTPIGMVQWGQGAAFSVMPTEAVPLRQKGAVSPTSWSRRDKKCPLRVEEKDIKKGAKSTGKKLKPSAVDNLVEVEQKAMSKAASKIIDVSFKTFGYSYNFYSDIYEDTK